MMFAGPSTRAPPPSGQPPPYVFGRYYRQSLRPLVIGMAFVTALWALLWGVSSFQDISGDKNHNFGSIVPFDIVLGALYMTVSAIEIYGIFAAFRQSLPLVRLYSLLSVVAMLITIAAEVLHLVVNFTFKSKLIQACTDATTGDTVVDDDFGFFGTHHAHNLTATEAQNFCNSAFNHITFTDIVWLIVAIILGLLFTSIAYSYYLQLLDPSSVATRFPRSNNVPLQSFGARYGQQGYGYNPYQEPYAPPYDNTKLPAYGYTATGSFEPPKDEKPKDTQAEGPSH